MRTGRAVRSRPATAPPARSLLLVCVALAVVLSLARALRPDILVSLDSLAYDTLVQTVPRRPPAGDVLIVDLDEESLAALGQWPWPRYRVAALLDRITALGPAAVGLDLVFAEPDRSSPRAVEQQLRRETGIAVRLDGVPRDFYDHDTRLAATLARGRYVLGYPFLYPGVERPSEACVLHPLPATVRARPGTPESGVPFHEATGAACNLPVLARGAGASGFFNAVPDPDGRLRRLPVLTRYQGRLYPSLALATLLRAERPGTVVVTVNARGVESLQIGAHTIPLDARGNALINYRGPRRTFPSVSAVALMRGRVAASRVRNRIVLVGSSAAGLHELRATPLDAAVPGVEVHATAIDNVLQHDLLRVPPDAPAVELAVVLLGGVAAGLLFAWTSAALSLTILVGTGTGVWMTARWLLTQGIFVSPVGLLLVFAVEFAGLSALKLWRTDRVARQRMRELLRTQDAAIRSLAGLAEVRDAETGGHILRTQHYIRVLAQELGRERHLAATLDAATIEAMRKMAPLHDVGKIAIPDAILLKPGRLSPEEFAVMKRHTVVGHRIFAAAEGRLGSNSFLRLADQLAHSHHERWDGTGYPQGLAGTEIPLAGRIMAVVDVYDALVSHRPYKAPLSHAEAVATIAAGRGSQFDPEVVDAFLRVAHEFEEIKHRCGERGERGTPGARMRTRDAEPTAPRPSPAPQPSGIERW